MDCGVYVLFLIILVGGWEERQKQKNFILLP